MKQVWQTLLLLAGVILAAPAVTSSAFAADNAAQRALLDKTAGKALLTRNAQGRVAHLRATNAPIAVDALLNPDTRARKVLTQYREAFLDPAVPLDLVTTRLVAPDASGRSHVRYRQYIKGIPVRGGEVIVHMDKRGVTSISSKLRSDIDLTAFSPTINVGDALMSAERSLRGRLGRVQPSLSTPQLEVLSGDLIVTGKTRGSRLAWRIEAVGLGVDQQIWVDAYSGIVLLSISNIMHAAEVSDFDTLCFSQSQTAPLYSATNLPPANSEAERGYNNVGHAEAYFAASFSFNGIDGAAGNTSAAVNVAICDQEIADIFASRPEKAAWYQKQIVLQPGVAAAEDVVGHEFTHGVIENTSGLLAARESGALAEGFADIFGELVDLVQVSSNDSGQTRWDFGEAVAGGPFRNLKSPQDFGMPGKVTDSTFYCGVDESLWSHRNGAVLAHAFALLADGGSYNGFDIQGVGVQKAALVFFDTMKNGLLEASTFLDAFNELKVSGNALLASAERAELAKVLDAVELDRPPCSAKINYCPVGQTPVALFNDGFENPASGKWNNTVTTGVNHWTDADENKPISTGMPPIFFRAEPKRGVDPSPTPQIDPMSGVPLEVGIAPNSGSYALWGNTGRPVSNGTGDSNVAMAESVLIPGGARMQYESRIAFHWTPDSIGENGGVIEFSTDGGMTWQDAGSMISGGQAYTGVIASGLGNPLENRQAFVGIVGDTTTSTYKYVSSQLDLASLAGKSARFRFRIGTERWNTDFGWQVDDVSIYTCTNAALIVTPTEGLTTSESGGTATFTVRLGGAPTSSVTVSVTSNDTSEGSVSPTELVFDATNYSEEQVVTVTGVDDSDRDGPIDYTVTVAVHHTSDPGYEVAPSVDVALTNENNDKKKGGGAANLWVLGVLLSLVILRIAFSRRVRIASLHR